MMGGEKGWVVFTTALVLLSLAAFSGTVAAAGETTVGVEPGSQNVSVGDTTNYSVVVGNAQDDVWGFEFGVELSNGNAADIVDVRTDLIDESEQGTTGTLTTSYGASNDSVEVGALKFASSQQFSSNSPTILTVEVRGDSAGQTDLNIVPLSSGEVVIIDQNLGSYTVTGTTNASLDVQTPSTPQIPGAQGPATDRDSDGKFEDVNGDGSFTASDVTFLFNNRNVDAVRNSDAFDFNNNGGFNAADITRLFNLLRS